MLKIEQVSTAHHKGDFALEYHDQFSKEPPKVMPRTRGNPTHTGNGNSNNDNSSNCNNAVISWRARESIQSFNDLRSSYIEAFLAGQVLQAEGIKGEMSKHFEDLKTETDKLQASVEKNNELQAVNSDLLRQVHDMNETMLNMQQKALDRLANLQTRIQAVLTQTYQLHEYPIPRLFIILPRAARRRDAILKPLAYQFRLYFLCECGPHTTQAGSKETDKVHMANHPGYDLERPTEFFNRYGHYILLVMRALQLGVRLASVVIPHLASSTLAQELKQAERGLQFQQQTGHDFYTNDNIGAMMDRTISYLEDRTRHHHGLGGYGKKHDESNPTSDASSILSDAELIEGVELKKLERFLVSVDKNRTLGNLYRTVTREGHVKWVCRTHFRQNYREQARMRFLDVVQENGGSYNEPQGQVILNLASRTLAKAFYTALVQTHGVQELDVTLTWDATLADLRAFAEAIIKSTVMNLTFHGWHLRGPATDYFNRNRQYEPLLQIFAEGRIQIVQVWGLPNLFERCASLISSSSNNKMASTLRVLDMCLITEESGSMFLEMLKRCPVLQKLTVNAPNEGIVLGSIRNCPSLREMVVRQDSLSMKNILKLTNEVVVLKRQRCYQQHGKDYLLRLGSLIITTETDSVLSSFSAEGLSGITPLLSNDHDLQVLLEEYGWAMDHLDLSSSAQKNLARFLNALDFSVVKFLGIYQCKVSFENWHVLLDRLSMYSSSSSLPHDQGAMMAVETIEFVKTGLEQTRKATDGTMQTQLTHRAPLARLIVE
ncbi:hypothetical protein BGZ83_008194 [Gryganskiella cystojenkinii]|nr:hypothetical protein BGZ83_008194 [Gryganskiella cystojenkinii]